MTAAGHRRRAGSALGDLIRRLEAVEGLSVRVGERLAGRSAWRLGGRVPVWALAETEPALLAAVEACHEAGVPLHPVQGRWWVAPDAPPGGVWIALGGLALGLERCGEGRVAVGAELPAAAVHAWAAGEGLALPPEWGCQAGTVAEVLRWGEPGGVEVLGVRALVGRRIRTLPLERLRDRHLAIRVELAVGRGRPEALWAAARELARTRRGPGPLAALYREPGAPELLEDAGLAGLRLRGLALGRAECHVLTNRGGGSSADLDLLVGMVRHRLQRAVGRAPSPTCRTLAGRIG